MHRNRLWNNALAWLRTFIESKPDCGVSRIDDSERCTSHTPVAAQSSCRRPHRTDWPRRTLRRDREALVWRLNNLVSYRLMSEQDSPVTNRSNASGPAAPTRAQQLIFIAGVILLLIATLPAIAKLTPFARVFAAAGLIITILMFRAKLFSRSRPTPPGRFDWYSVTFDRETVTLTINPPGQTSQAAQFRWHDISSVSLRTHAPWQCDTICVTTTDQSHCFIIPTQAHGAHGFTLELIDRNHLTAASAAPQPDTIPDSLSPWPELTVLPGDAAQ